MSLTPLTVPDGRILRQQALQSTARVEKEMTEYALRQLSQRAQIAADKGEESFVWANVQCAKTRTFPEILAHHNELVQSEGFWKMIGEKYYNAERGWRVEYKREMARDKGECFPVVTVTATMLE
jgi:hypothetical protein